MVVGTGDKYCLWNMRDNIKAQPRSYEWRELNRCVLKDNPKIKRKACWFYVSAPVVWAKVNSFSLAGLLE